LNKALYIGDTNADMIQSEKAGVPFIFMRYGFGQCENFDQSFDSFEDFARCFLNA
jgi:phosphoglycolate phosphatase